jgi:hypothetical protein
MAMALLRLTGLLLSTGLLWGPLPWRCWGCWEGGHAHRNAGNKSSSVHPAFDVLQSPTAGSSRSQVPDLYFSSCHCLLPNKAVSRYPGDLE